MAEINAPEQRVLDGWVDGINYNRGVIIRGHPTGMKVCMYVDEPGVFRSAHGKEVDPELAREAGFDIDVLLKERSKRKRLADAAKVIEQEFNGGEQEVVYEKHGFKVVTTGAGRHNVLDPEGNRLNAARPLTEDEAVRLLNLVAKVSEEQESE